MCWNEPVSWATFGIGTALSVISAAVVRKPAVIAVSIVWIWVLLMQFFEALMWRDQKCGKLNKFATTGAYVANIMQPIVIFIVLIVACNPPAPYKIVAGIVVAVYACYMLANAFRMESQPCTEQCEDGKNCKHLYYKWWDKMKAGGLIYVLAIVALILLLCRPIWFGIFEVGYILLTLLVASRFFGKSTASTWCWLAAFAPLFTIFFWKMSSRIEVRMGRIAP